MWVVYALGTFFGSAFVGWAAARLSRRYVWLAWAMTGFAVWAAEAYIGKADPAQEYGRLVRALVLWPPLFGWVLGVSAASLWMLARHVKRQARRRATMRP